MKLLYCITRSDTLGGAHIHVADMAAWMRKNGHDASVVVGREGPYCDHLVAKQVPYIVSRHLCRPISALSDVCATRELRRIFKANAPDLISLHSAKAGLIGRVASMGTGMPVLFTAHGWPFTEGVSKRKAWLYRGLERLTAPLARRIIAVSEYDRTLALNARVGKPDQVTAVHNAMPDGSALAHPGRRNGPVRITMVARLDEPKDHEALLNALATLSDRDWELDLIGDGPGEDTLRDKTRQLGLENRIRFLGLRRDVDVLLAESQMFVLTSRWEGFPRSILEAMRAGLPVVASAVGGIPESVDEDVTGYLVPRGDADKLVERLAHLIDNPDERVRLGQAGRQRFEEQFRFERMANRTFEIYEEILRDN